MDILLARRIESDEAFSQKVVKLAKDYLELGQQAVNYWFDEFDTAHDILMCYAPLTKADLENLERGHPKRFVLPMSSTQITTMATYLSQVLFGDEQPHKVDGRGPEDEVGAEHMNQLLRWNAEQQPTYLLGYLWIQDCLTYNRGIFYNSWEPIYDTDIQSETVELPDEFEDDGVTPKTYERPKRVRIPVGGYSKYHLVSPYDFICDPALPLWRMQEGRFAGHRTIISWQELKRRSELPQDDPAYVLPSAVEALKKKKRTNNSNTTQVPTASNIATSRKDTLISRTAFERTRVENNPNQNANAEDPGMIQCHCMYIRLVPADNEIGDEAEPLIYQFLIGNNDVVLSVGMSSYKHDEFPYNVGEGRPSGYYQFSPGWAMHLKSLQDYIDYYKNRRQQAISRTLGNVFIARTDQVDIADFCDPDKEGLIIPVLPEAVNSKLDDIIKQVQVNDTTKEFHNEMKDFISFSETVTGVNSQMQGQVEGDSTATEFAGTQQMSAGRLASLARLLSVQALVPQAKQIVANFQQFLTESMSIRFVGTGVDTPAPLSGQRALQITPDIIQGRFDYVAHDGSLPGTDNRKVAAISRLLEAATAFPMYFSPAPGNIDARALILSGAKAAGLNVENFQFKDMPQGVPPGAPGQPASLPTLPDISASLAAGAGPIAQPGPGRPPTPDPLNVPSASPKQIRPSQL